MAITAAMCTSFKVELFKALHNFSVPGSGGHAFKIALYTSASTMDATTTAYGGPTNEVTGTNYIAGGTALTIPADPTSTPVSASTGTAFVDFSDASWASSVITARGALIYNTQGAANRAVAVLDFGSDKPSSGGSFTIVFPVADKDNAILRLA